MHQLSDQTFFFFHFLILNVASVSICHCRRYASFYQFHCKHCLSIFSHMFVQMYRRCFNNLLLCKYQKMWMVIFHLSMLCVCVLLSNTTECMDLSKTHSFKWVNSSDCNAQNIFIFFHLLIYRYVCKYVFVVRQSAPMT